MRCPACGGENPDGKRFCRNCAASLTAVCSACGAQLEPDDRFCGECASPVGAAVVSAAVAAAAVVTASSPQHVAVPSTELRHVSVLFCDLVGFTPLSESRDAEDVRELLSGYFELARTIVAKYGGVIEKFIGDAVMAVWGAPVATEDDAERAVRSGLELVSAVAAYGSEHELDLQARVGIVTGGAATTTADEGLVIGDRVNTAARIQSVRPARLLLRRRRHEERHLACDRLRGRRRAHPEGEGHTGTAPPGHSGGGGGSRYAACRCPRGPLCRT
jgi:class 3 adenylate cyclase